MKCHPVDILEESVRIPGEGGELDGVLAYPFAEAVDVAALVIGPHPLMGGRLENNVVRAVGRGLAEHGLATLRFRFGGEGPSAAVMDAFWETGHAPDDPVRKDDALAAFNWLKQTARDPIMLVGYSFGASLMAGLHDDPRVHRLVLIGPTLRQHSFDSIRESALPKLLITADNDFATPLSTTLAWFEQAREPKKLILIEAAEHFYRNVEDRLVKEMVDWMQC